VAAVKAGYVLCSKTHLHQYSCCIKAAVTELTVPKIYGKIERIGL